MEREVRAIFDNHSITVYQAYKKEIADSAILNQKFVSPPFKKERMTWVKPSFFWMMYRSGWASKEDQSCVLSIKIKREGFDWALNHSCLSHFDHEIYESEEIWKKQLINNPVRIQWDPERDKLLNAQKNRAIQIGLSGIAVDKFINDWILEIKDITSYCKLLEQNISVGNFADAEEIKLAEKVYPLPLQTKLHIKGS